MGIEINLEHLNISGNAEVMENAKIRNNNDVYIGLRHSDISERAKILNNLEIDSMLKELMRQAQIMDKDSIEYPKIKEILNVKRWDKTDFIKCISKHISEFSQGVLASIVANFITK